jgi:hypothetical protein
MMQNQEAIVVNSSSSDEEEFEWEPEEDHEQVDAPDAAAAASAATLAAATTTAAAAADATTTAAATATAATAAAANEVVEVPDHLAFFCCPFTYALMRNPMMCADGHSYEEANIQHWLSNNDKSPLTNLRHEHKTLTPNHNLQNAIEIWVEEVNAKKRSEAEVDEEKVEAQQIEGKRERLAVEEEAERGEAVQIKVEKLAAEAQEVEREWRLSELMRRDW